MKPEDQKSEEGFISQWGGGWRGLRDWAELMKNCGKSISSSRPPAPWEQGQGLICLSPPQAQRGAGPCSAFRECF